MNIVCSTALHCSAASLGQKTSVAPPRKVNTSLQIVMSDLVLNSTSFPPLCWSPGITLSPSRGIW